MALLFGGSGISSGRSSTEITLQAGQTYLIPAGTWAIDIGPYTDYQVFDSQTNTWRVSGDPGGASKWIMSDGVNHRLANQSGCVVGATVTSGGAGYTSAPVITINSGGAKFTAVLGPVVNTITVVNGGTGYVYPPLVYINPPPAGGVAATAYSTISGGVVSSVTVTDQGAGYNTGVPLVTLTNDPRDTVGTGATAVASLTGTGTVAALLLTDPGTPSGISTSGTLPTITLTGGGYTTIATAVPVMAWSLTSYTVQSVGLGYITGGTVFFSGSTIASGTAIYTNPTIQKNVVRARPCNVGVLVSSGATTLVTGGTVYDGGVLPQGFTTLQTAVNAAQTGVLVSASAVNVGGITPVYGGTTDVAVLLPV